jgi:DNA-binding NtrC family response regulator
MRAKGRIFLLDDDEFIVAMLARALRSQGYEVQAETSPAEVLGRIRSFAPDVVLLDLKLPGASGMDLLKELVDRGVDTQVVMVTSDDSAESAVKAMKMGAADYLTKPFDLEEVKLVVASLVEKANLRQEVEYLRKVSSDLKHRDIVGTSDAIRELKESAAKLAKACVPTVLITGENGTGKELFARYIHGLMCADQPGCAPFIGINCAALPEPLIESELFGHERGSFTDAKTEKKGMFELAAGGAILLDEIGEMKWNLQAKLLRVVEERKVRRVGGSHDLPIDATVIATTNRDLVEAMKGGEFRTDLFYRLATFSLHVPPLRERTEDVIPLAQHFLTSFAAKYGRSAPSSVSPEARRLLVSYRWPGNVRELRNVIERIVVLESGDTILPEHLPKELLFARRHDTVHAPASGITLPDEGISLDEIERTLIFQALARCGGNKAQTAKLLGITYDSLRYQIKKFGLEAGGA